MADAPPDPAVPHNPAHARLKTGARQTPAHKILQARRFTASAKVKAARPITVPAFLEMWLNDTYGICVTAEQCAAFAMYSVMLGLPEVKITDAAELAFANKYGFRDGANLTEVMDKMASDGFHQDGKDFKDGPYASVDYSNQNVLMAAIERGPISIAIDSSALPSGAGNQSGWSDHGGRPGQWRNTDHCVGIWNHGPSVDLFKALGAPVPSGFPDHGYHLYTWSTVGVVDHDWLMSTCVEAWLRDPTLLGLGPGPGPEPTPGVLQGVLAITSPEDAAGSFAIGGGAGLSPEQVANLQAAQALIQSVLPADHAGVLTAEDMAAIYRYAFLAGLSEKINWISLIRDLLKLAADTKAKNWQLVMADVQAILIDLAA